MKVPHFLKAIFNFCAIPRSWIQSVPAQKSDHSPEENRDLFYSFSSHILSLPSYGKFRGYEVEISKSMEGRALHVLAENAEEEVFIALCLDQDNWVTYERLHYDKCEKIRTHVHDKSNFKEAKHVFVRALKQYTPKKEAHQAIDRWSPDLSQLSPNDRVFEQWDGVEGFENP